MVFEMSVIFVKPFEFSLFVNSLPAPETKRFVVDLSLASAYLKPEMQTSAFFPAETVMKRRME